MKIRSLAFIAAWMISSLAFATASGQTNLMVAASAPSKPQFLQVANEIFYPTYYVAPNDIDGDGLSDLLWFNASASQFAYWILSPNNTNTSYARDSYKIFNITPGYYIGAIGDFNNDRKADLIWTSANNDLYMWTSTGTSFLSTYIGTYPAGWQLIGAGDIDGDGDADLLWWNESTCQFGYWIMHGTTVATLKTINVTCGYHIAAIGHFMQTTHVDLLWTNAAAHDLYLWAGLGAGFKSILLGDYDPQGRVIGAAVAGDFGGVNIYVQNDGALQFKQYEQRTYINSNDQVTLTTFGLINTFPIKSNDYLAATGNFDNGNEAVLIWANDTSNATSSLAEPGSLNWYTSTFSNANQDWLSTPIGSYPSNWTLVGARN
jgi:hypothetical protein